MKITPIQLAKRVEQWAKRLASLGVAHWQFDVVLADAVPGSTIANASVHFSNDYDFCTFSFRNGFLEDIDEEELDIAIIHEWLHVAFRDYEHVIDDVENWMPPATYEQHHERLTHELEGLIQRLAVTIYGLHANQNPRFTP